VAQPLAAAAESRGKKRVKDSAILVSTAKYKDFAYFGWFHVYATLVKKVKENQGAAKKILETPQPKTQICSISKLVSQFREHSLDISHIVKFPA